MIPINFDARLDPHFGEGKLAPIHADIFVVYASKKGVTTITRKKFIIALPPQYTWEDTKILMSEIMSRILRPQDTYTFDDLDWETFSNNLEYPKLPVLSYDPRDEKNFVWILPPREMRH